MLAVIFAAPELLIATIRFRRNKKRDKTRGQGCPRSDCSCGLAQVVRLYGMGKTVRFAQLVAAAGKPYVATLWTQPKDDRHFARAVRENRVLTVHQTIGSGKKDFGVVGFHEDKNVSYLVFPKRLRAQPETQVIGIKYDMLAPEPVADPLKRAPVAPKRGRIREHTSGSSATPIQIEETQYSAVVKRTAVWERLITVRAANKAEAKRKVATEANAQTYEIHDAVVRDEIRGMKASR
jgi:hypothetical protein